MNEPDTDGMLPYSDAVLALQYLDNQDADFLLYSGQIDRDSVDRFIWLARGITEPKPNLTMALTTYGGDADAAYRLATYVTKRYQRVTMLVPGYCKSAGTLVAFGASRIVMGELGEFGPLDVQVVRRDDVQSTGSGLDITQAIIQVSASSAVVFEQYFNRVLAAGQGAISTKTATEVAWHASVGLLTPIMAQIDPLQLGEITRLNTTARAYANRLRPADGEIIVSRLIHKYPSHGYCIGADEASELFGNVEGPGEEAEYKLINWLEVTQRYPPRDPVLVDGRKLLEETRNVQQAEHQRIHGEPGDGRPGGQGDQGSRDEVRAGDKEGSRKPARRSNPAPGDARSGEA